MIHINSFINKYWIFLYTLAVSPAVSFVALQLLKLGVLRYDSLFFYLLTTTLFFILMLVVPLLIIKKSNDAPEKYGFKFPDNPKEALGIILATTLATVLVIFLISKNQSFQKFYLLKHPVDAWFFVEIIISFFYFVSEEFFFRGYLLNKLTKNFGVWAIIISNVLFAIAHIGKPGYEYVFAFFYGILLATISKKTGSFFPAAIIHFLIALILNLFILYS